MADDGMAASLGEMDSAAGNHGAGQKDSPAGFTNESSTGEGLYGRSAAVWAAVKSDHADKMQTLASIAQRHGLTKWQLSQATKLLGWVPRTQPRATSRTLVARMMDLLVAHVGRLEKGPKAAGNADAELLTKLVGTFGKLRDMQKADGAAATKPRSSAEMIDIRNKLIQRIEDLKRR